MTFGTSRKYLVSQESDFMRETMPVMNYLVNSAPRNSLASPESHLLSPMPVAADFTRNNLDCLARIPQLRLSVLMLPCAALLEIIRETLNLESRNPRENCTFDHANDCAFVQCTLLQLSRKTCTLSSLPPSKSAESLFTPRASKS